MPAGPDTEGPVLVDVRPLARIGQHSVRAGANGVERPTAGRENEDDEYDRSDEQQPFHGHPSPSPLAPRDLRCNESRSWHQALSVEVTGKRQALTSRGAAVSATAVTVARPVANVRLATSTDRCGARDVRSHAGRQRRSRRADHECCRGTRPDPTGVLVGRRRSLRSIVPAAPARLRVLRRPC